MVFVWLPSASGLSLKDTSKIRRSREYLYNFMVHIMYDNSRRDFPHGKDMFLILLQK